MYREERRLMATKSWPGPSCRSWTNSSSACGPYLGDLAGGSRPVFGDIASARSVHAVKSFGSLFVDLLNVPYGSWKTITPISLSDVIPETSHLASCRASAGCTVSSIEPTNVNEGLLCTNMVQPSGPPVIT